MITVRTGGTYVGPEYTAIPLTLTEGVTEVIFCPWCRDLFVQVTLAGLAASGESIDVTVEGSLDNVGWDNLAASGLATTINSDGTTLLTFRGALPPYVRISMDTSLVIVETATVTLQAYIQVIS